MSEETAGQQEHKSGWRLKAGIAIFILSIILPLAGVPAVMTLNLSASVMASVSGAMLVCAELMGVAAVAVMGKPGFVYIKSKVSGFFRQYGPPQQVSRRRYNIGLVMFCFPFLFAFISVYAHAYIPGYSANPIPYAITGDILLITSLFVLGGDFWDKLRGLFVYNDKICTSPPAAEKQNT